MRIACVGDNVVDINYLDRVINPGGNCINVSVYSAQMGHDSAYVGVLADDIFADIIKKSLDENGVVWKISPVLHGETGRCFINLINGDRVIGDENDGGLVKSNPLQITPNILKYLKGFDVIHTVCYAYLDDQLYKFHEVGLEVVYDFSTDWIKKDMDKVCPYIDYLLLSDIDGVDYNEGKNRLRKFVRKYDLKLGIMTFGTRGACVYDGRTMFEKKPYNIEGGAIDTTGCGDSWISGFITTYIEGMKRFRRMKENGIQDYLTSANETDYKHALIKESMCMGNLRARLTSQIKGGYGYGKTFSDAGYKNKLY